MKPRPFAPKPIPLEVGFIVALALLNPQISFGQTQTPLSGTVSSNDGHPIGNVLVYGSESQSCCPIKREQTRTDASGRFTLREPGAVVHFFKEGFEPKSLVVKPGISKLRITLDPPNDDMVVPLCSKPTHGRRRIVRGNLGLHFDVPKRDVKILGGKPDVDYVRYVIKPKSGNDYLELWFGLYAMSSDPDDEQFIHSVSFRERNVVDAKGEQMGTDSSGKLDNGKIWRHTFVISEGARYEASPENAALFDSIVNSACYTPAQKN